MFEIKVTVPSQGSKNAAVHVVGITDEEFSEQPLVRLEDLNPIPRKIRIDNVLFAIQEKMGIILWWDKDKLILPLESRGAFRFDQGINSPSDWSGTIWGSSVGVDTNSTYAIPKHFFLILDLEKQ